MSEEFDQNSTKLDPNSISLVSSIQFYCALEYHRNIPVYGLLTLEDNALRFIPIVYSRKFTRNLNYTDIDAVCIPPLKNRNNTIAHCKEKIKTSISVQISMKNQEMHTFMYVIDRRKFIDTLKSRLSAHSSRQQLSDQESINFTGLLTTNELNQNMEDIKSKYINQNGNITNILIRNVIIVASNIIMIKLTVLRKPSELGYSLKKHFWCFKAIQKFKQNQAAIGKQESNCLNFLNISNKYLAGKENTTYFSEKDAVMDSPNHQGIIDFSTQGKLASVENELHLAKQTRHSSRLKLGYLLKIKD
ncbi:hypothetical protein GJ496_002445 [Pomphorhynchus laevis]|nr:hypothetical protein GJ496_002445 [Pomphorhynchus laevis]